MKPPTLGLMVLRSADIAASLAFYQALGLRFVQEQHGAGPIHYSCELGQSVIEIYPGKSGSAPDRRAGGATMLGFQVESLENTLAAIQALGAVVLTPPQTNPWGRHAVVADPDGRAIDLNESLAEKGDEL